uniref:Myosin motor domain-containing protein n=1 Tax=Rhizophora mucronata TaxID=61149 RepID=A0A2P2KG50_RHIMU
MQSVCTKFKGQLFKLLHQLENTTPHFIRCIKPNAKQHPGVYEEDLVLQQLRCCGVLEVVRISRSGFPTRMTHLEFSRRYGFLLVDTNVSQDPLSISVAILQQFNLLPEMYQVGYTKLYLRTGQIGKLEEQRKQLLQGILGIQKCFRGCQARQYFHEVKKGVTTLQSFIRGENARMKYGSIAKNYAVNASQTVDEHLAAIICLQSAIRGWLAQQQLSDKCKLKRRSYENTKRKPGKKISEVKIVPQEQVEAQSSILAELQKRVVKAEAALGQKEEENASLREQLQHSERRWSEYEARMKTMEEMWQMQMASLQASLAAARKSLAADNTAGQPGKLDSSTSPHGCDSEDNLSGGSQTPGGGTINKVFGAIPGFRAGRDNNGSINVVNSLAKEFEQRTQNFEDDARALVDVSAGQSASTINPDQEIRKLKLRFETWKKEYKVRLWETKARVHKLRHGDKKSCRKWWGRISARAS